MSDLKVSILSPAKVVVRTSAAAVQVPGTLGYMGILPGHAKLISEIGVGEIALDGTDNGRQVFFVAGGYVDVSNDKVTLLVDVVEAVGDIDATRAAKAKARAAERLERKAHDVDVARAQAAMARAQQRLAMANRGH